MINIIIAYHGDECRRDEADIMPLKGEESIISSAVKVARLSAVTCDRASPRVDKQR